MCLKTLTFDIEFSVQALIFALEYRTQHSNKCVIQF